MRKGPSRPDTSIRSELASNDDEKGLAMLHRPCLLLKIAALATLALLAAACGEGNSASEPAEAETSSDEGGEETDQSYPSRPLEVVVPYAPGGGQDRFGRLIAQTAGEYLGVPMVIRNVPGGSGTVGNARVAQNSDNDHEILFTDFASMTLLPHMADVPYSLDDFEPIIEVASEPLILTAGPSSPVETFEELLEYGQDNPGELTLATPGIGESGHVTFAGLFDALDVEIEFNHVPFDGASEVVAATLGGEADIMTSTVASVLEYYESGQFTPLAISSTEPHDAVPDVPNFDDLGAPEASRELWRTFFAPAWFDDADIAVLQEAFTDAVEDEGFTALAEKVGESAVVSTEDLAEKYEEQFEANGRTLEKLGILEE